MQSVASVPFKSFNLNAFKWARGVYQEGMRQRFAAVGASLCGHQYFLLPLSAPKFCLKSSYCFWYTTSNVPFSHYLRIEKQLTARLDFCGFAHISGSFILWGRGSLPLLRLLRGVIRYSPGLFSLLHPADSADYDLLLRALTQHLTSPIILLISLCLALIAPLMLYGGSDESPYLSPHPVPPPTTKDTAHMSAIAASSW